MKKIRRMISILTAVLMLLSCGILAAAEGELPEAAEIEAPAAEPVQEAKAEAPAPVKEEAKQEAPAPAPAKEEAKQEAPAAEPAKEAKEEAPAAEPAEEAKEEAPAAEPAEEAKEEAPAAAAPAVQLKVAVKADCGTRSVLLGAEVTLRAEVEGADEYDVRWEARDLSWRRSNNAEEAEKAWTEVSKDKKYTFTVSESDAALEFRAVINGGEGVSDGYTLPKIEKPAEKAEEPAEEPEEPVEEPAEEPAESDEVSEEPAEQAEEPEAAAEEPAQAEAEPVKAEEPEEKPAEKKAEKSEKAEKTEEIEDYETPLDSGIHYEYERNEDGSLKLDENGNPVAILEEGQNIPKTWLRDENGALVLDAEGNPVATQTVPADSVLVHSLQDQLDPNRSIDIYVSFVDGDAALGGTACFFAVLNGYDSLVYSLQWQESADGVNWMNLAAANQDRLEVVTSEENMHNFWRVEVTITSVQG